MSEASRNHSGKSKTRHYSGAQGMSRGKQANVVAVKFTRESFPRLKLLWRTHEMKMSPIIETQAALGPPAKFSPTNTLNHIGMTTVINPI